MSEAVGVSIGKRGMKGVFRTAHKLLISKFEAVENVILEGHLDHRSGVPVTVVRALRQEEDLPGNRSEVQGFLWRPQPNSSKTPVAYAAKLGIKYKQSSDGIEPATIKDDFALAVTDEGQLRFRRVTDYRVAIRNEEYSINDTASQDLAKPLLDIQEVSTFLTMAITVAAQAITDRPQYVADVRANLARPY